MRLMQIIRYPVKSLQGETLSSAEIQPTGLQGDRCWGIRDESTRRILTARRAPQLRFASAALAADNLPVITLPTGETCHGPGPETDAALSTWLGKPVRLVTSLDAPPGRAEYFADATDDASDAIEWTMPAGRFVDALPLLLLTTASLRAAAKLHPTGNWHPQRFRANLVIDVADEGWVEDGWCGNSDVLMSDVRLKPQEGCIRCTMITRAQPGVVEDREIFRVLARNHNARFGAWTSIVAAGEVHVDDLVSVEPASSLDIHDLVANQRGGDQDAFTVELA